MCDSEVDGRTTRKPEQLDTPNQRESRHGSDVSYQILDWSWIRSQCIIFSASPAVRHLLCITCCASPAVHHLQCITCCTSPTVQHLRCITYSASPEVHHLLCITYSATPAVHHMQCITWGASPAVHHLRCITCGASPAVQIKSSLGLYLHFVFKWGWYPNLGTLLQALWCQCSYPLHHIGSPYRRPFYGFCSPLSLLRPRMQKKML